MRVRLSKRVSLEPGHLVQDVDVDISFDHQGGDVATSRIWAEVAEALAAQHGRRGAAQPVARLLGSEWRAPDGIHGRAWKTAHRALAALAKADGRGMTVPELHEKTGISLVPLYNLLKPDESIGAYVEPYIRVTKMGRAQVLDLTSEGRRMASLIRAGKVPS